MIFFEPFQSDFFNKNVHVCLACGVRLSIDRQQYCSPFCLRQLKEYLNRRTGLLVALNTRYASFYFTNFIIVMDILPYGANQIFSFILARTPGNKPVADFCDMLQILGNIWWSEKKRTRKRYRANLLVLEKAEKVNSELNKIIPRRFIVPAVKKRDLQILSLNITDLLSNSLEKKLKHAYRSQAKRHHPDLGGDASKFRQLQGAYEKMTQWSENPIFMKIKGFPDKWFYEGSTNRWIQPLFSYKPAADFTNR